MLNGLPVKREDKNSGQKSITYIEPITSQINKDNIEKKTLTLHIQSTITCVRFNKLILVIKLLYYGSGSNK